MGADTDQESCHISEEALEDKLDSFLQNEDLVDSTLGETLDEEPEGSSEDEDRAAHGVEETLEEKFESILNDNILADLLSASAAAAPDAAPTPVATSEDAAAPVAVALAEDVVPAVVASAGDVSPAAAASAEDDVLAAAASAEDDVLAAAASAEDDVLAVAASVEGVSPAAAASAEDVSQAAAASAEDVVPADAASAEDVVPADASSAGDAAPASVALTEAGPRSDASSEATEVLSAADSEDEADNRRATDFESDDDGTALQSDPYGEAQASFADMATLALQLESMRALLGETNGEMPSGDSEEMDVEIPDSAAAEDASAATTRPTADLLSSEAEPGAVRADAVAEEAADGNKAMVSAKRWEVQRSIFRSLDLDGDGRLSCAELLSFAALAGFDGPEEDWAEEFKDLCDAHAGGDEGGPTLPCFRAMLDDNSDDGFYCTDKELAGLHRRLLRQRAGDAEPREPEPEPRKILGIPPELLTPGPRALLPMPQLFEADVDQLECPVPEADAEAPEGEASGGGDPALEGDYDLLAVVRQDPSDAIDAEELLRKAWEEREAEGEELGDFGEEGEEETVVEVWGDLEGDPYPAHATGRPRRPPARQDLRGAGVDTEVVTELMSEMVTEAMSEMATEQLEIATEQPELATERLEMATDVETEMATEPTQAVLVKGSPKRSLPVGVPIIQPVSDESNLLDELLVQAGVAHLAEEQKAEKRRREGEKRGHKHPSQQESGQQHSQNKDAERPAKSRRRGALRGGPVASAPPSMDAAVPTLGGPVASAPASSGEAEALAMLQEGIMRLGTREAMKDRRTIPDLAGRIAKVHLPILGTARAFDAMSATLVRQDVVRSHKLAIMYVFHEMLLRNSRKSGFVPDSTKHFLEPVGWAIAELPRDKLGPFIKLLGMWTHVFTDRYLKHLKNAWTSSAGGGLGRSAPGLVKT